MKYNDETQRVTRRNIAVSLGLAILLVALILVSAVIYGCNRPQEIVKPPVDIQQPEQPGDVTNDIGDELSSGVVYPMPKSLLFSSPTSESTVAAAGVTLRATVSPANAANPALNWSVSFLNPVSAWALGKEPHNYVTVTPTSDGAATATVTCLQAFGSPIVISVRSLSNADAVAICKVDYHWRFDEPEFTVFNGRETHKVSAVDPGNSDNYSAILVVATEVWTFGELTLKPNNTTYTISPTDSPAVFSYECRFVPDFIDFVERELSSELDFSDLKYELLDVRFDMVGSTDFNAEFEDKIIAAFRSALPNDDAMILLDFIYSESAALQNILVLEATGRTKAQSETYSYVFRLDV